MTYYTVLKRIKAFKKCIVCNKKSKIVISQFVDNAINIIPICVKHFKKELPDYTLEYACISCPDNLKCDIQKVLFTSKEIKIFREDNDL